MSDAEKRIILAKRLIEMEKARSFTESYKEFLPHLYGWKWYSWARAFYDSTNKINLLCAANQISKSSTQIRKCIDHAVNKPKWSALWRKSPIQFWYLYPSQPVVNAEFMTKWVEFLPRGEMKHDPIYGWKELRQHGDTIGISFNSGVFVFFKTYTKDVQSLQTGTCDEIFCDEELPFNLFDELMLRISASDGYFNMVFTATLGQDEWRRAMEPKEGEDEFLIQAFKQTISMYDCMVYDDGSPSHWTAEKIAGVKARCGTDAEILKRVYGKFIVLGGRMYEAFDIARHVKPKHAIPKDWLIYEGVDIGSGGPTGHPAAIAFVAVRPDYREGRVFLGWRGDGLYTEVGDIVQKHLSLKRENNLFPTDQRYDWASSDFFQIATRMGETFNKADKKHDKGEGIVNTLFKNDMLIIYEDGELGKLAGELAALMHSTPKRVAKDDFCDALRYCVTTIPWDFGWLATEAIKVPAFEARKVDLTPEQIEMNERRNLFMSGDEKNDIEQEFDDWNDAYGN